MLTLQRRALYLSFICFMTVYINQTAVYAHERDMTIKIKASPESSAETILHIRSKGIIDKILKNWMISSKGIKPHFSDTNLQITEGQAIKNYLYFPDGTLYDESEQTWFQLDEKSTSLIEKYIEIARYHHFGQLIPWFEAKKIIPHKSKFEVIDLETGLRFHVQRRAGSKHADVQPITKADTKVMKEIYQGKWSWKRRAILVHTDGKSIAASMHGMPHGAGALRNGFPGHFCIHFYQSTTHRSKTKDLSHQVMVWKAAGRLQEFLEQATPYEIADLFLISLSQQDPYLLQLTLADENKQALDPLKEKMTNIIQLNRVSTFDPIDTEGMLAIEIPIQIRLDMKGRGVTMETIHVTLKRDSYIDRWQIIAETFSTQIKAYKESLLILGDHYE